MVMPKLRQVGMATDHLWWKRGVSHPGVSVIGNRFMPRIGHCAECPKCGTRYLIACSPYRNGSYLLPSVIGCWDEYVLYCCCRELPVASRWKVGEFKACEISKAAYDRGYGSAEEMPLLATGRREAWPHDAARHLANWKAIERRKNLPSGKLE
jgi:hypothetical protein